MNTQHAPGVPKILLGNRLHLAFKRQISEEQAAAYAYRNNMSFFEVSPLCNFNVNESLTELARIVLQRYGMDSLFEKKKVLSLKELCCRQIVSQATTYEIEKLPIPPVMKSCLKSYSSNHSDLLNSFKKSTKVYSHHHHPLPSLASGGTMSKKEKDSTLKRAKKILSCDTSSSNHHQVMTTGSRSRSSSGRPDESRITAASGSSNSRSSGSVSNSTRRNSSRHNKKFCTIC